MERGLAALSCHVCQEQSAAAHANLQPTAAARHSQPENAAQQSVKTFPSQCIN